MRAFLFLLIIALVVFGYFYYSDNGASENVRIEGDTVIVDAGNFEARFSTTGEFLETYMIFGGGYFSDKNLANPVALSGLEIEAAKDIYAKYPDFHMCKSAGAPLAQSKIKHLQLIPADGSALKNLKSLIAEHEENFSKGKERVCTTLTGKILFPTSQQFSGKNSTEERRMIHEIPPGPYYLISSSKRVDCKALLDSAGAKPTATGAGGKPDTAETGAKAGATELQASTESEITEKVTKFLERLSRRDINGAYAYTINTFRDTIPEKELADFIDVVFDGRTFIRQGKTAGILHPSGWLDIPGGGRKDAILYEYRSIVYFSDGSEKEFLVVFTEEGGEWKIARFDLTI